MNSPWEVAAAVASLQLAPAADAERLLKEWAPNAATVGDLLGLLESRSVLSAFQCEKLRQNAASGLAVGPYRLVAPLGEGGMGQVFKAYHPFMNRHVALKLIRPERLANADAIARFQREIQAAAQLEHPNIIRAYDAGQSERDVFYLAMELAEGQDLSRFLKEQGLLPADAACGCIRQAALGLAHAHERGLIHRDIKPANLFLTSAGVVKVLDLGLARLIHQDELTPTAEDDPALAASLTVSGAVMGTPDFMAPEQFHDTRLMDARSDIYSLGCTFYQLLAGKPPFEGHRTLHRKLHAHQHYSPDNPIERLRPDLPPGLAVLLRTMMAKKPEHRFPSMAKVAEALAPFAGKAEKLKLSPGAPPAFAPPPQTEVWSPPAARPPAETAAFDPAPPSTVEVTPAAAPAAPEPPKPKSFLGYSLAKQIQAAQALADAQSAEAKASRVAALEQVMRSLAEAGDLMAAYDAALAILELEPTHSEAAEVSGLLKEKLRDPLLRRRIGSSVSILFMALGVGAMIILPALLVLWLAFVLAEGWEGWLAVGAAYSMKALAGAWIFGIAMTGLGGAVHRRWLRGLGRTAALFQEGAAVFMALGGGALLCFVSWPGALACCATAYAIVILAHGLAPQGMPFETTAPKIAEVPRAPA